MIVPASIDGPLEDVTDEELVDAWVREHIYERDVAQYLVDVLRGHVKPPGPIE